MLLDDWVRWSVEEGEEERGEGCGCGEGGRGRREGCGCGEGGRGRREDDATGCVGLSTRRWSRASRTGGLAGAGGGWG